MPQPYKAKVVLATIRGEKMLAELVEQIDVHSNQIQDWGRWLLDNAGDLFGRGAKHISEAFSGILKAAA